MLGVFRAVFWFARMDPGSGVEGMVVVVRGKGEVITVPKGAKDKGVRGVALAVMRGAEIVGAIFP